MNRYLLAKNLSRYRRPVVILVIILGIYWIGTLSGIFTIPRLKAGDLFLNLKYRLSPRPKELNNIVIIGIDDSAYYTYGKKWPWERIIFAGLISRISKNKPAVIGLDLAFVGKSTTSGASDSLLAKAFRDAGNVLLVSYFDKEGRYIEPYKIFRKSALGYGFTNKPEDPDNVIRETKLFQEHYLKDEIIDYSFDLKAATAFRGGLLKDITYTGKEVTVGAQGETLKIPVSKSGVIPLDYSAKMRDFTVIPFGDVIGNRVSPDVVRDKIVLVGTTGEIFRDISFSPFGKIPSVGIIANTILMLLSGNFIYKVPPVVNTVLLLIVGLSVSIATSKRKIYYGTVLVLVILAIFTGLSLILIINNMSWDFFGIPAVVLTIYLTNGLTNYASLLVQGLKIKRFVITDILTGLSTRRYFLFKLDSALKNIREGESLSLVLFSIDNLRFVTSITGQEKANCLIKEVGRLISKFSRKTRGVDFIARYGESEFCSILYRTPEKGALTYVNRIMKIINTKMTLEPSLNLSAGIVNVGNLKEKSAKLFVRCAEIATDRSRRKGKVCIYDPELDKVPVVEYAEEKEISETDLSYVTEELKEKYNEMAILVNKLRIAQEEVVKGERLSAVGKVAATIHHDLDKPIVNIINCLRAAKRDLDRVDIPELSKAKRFIDSAAEETKRLEELSESLKDLYRPKKREAVPLNINLIIEEMLNLSSGRMSENNVKLSKRLSPDLPQVLADSSELKQVFLNLIHNAIESMPQGGSLEVVSSVAENKVNMVEVQVRDTGCGILPENLDRVFEAFFTTKKEEKGAGLGLYACMEILKNYSGTIQVESAVGKGTTFRVYLPFRPTG